MRRLVMPSVIICFCLLVSAGCNHYSEDVNALSGYEADNGYYAIQIDGKTLFISEEISLTQDRLDAVLRLFRDDPALIKKRTELTKIEYEDERSGYYWVSGEILQNWPAHQSGYYQSAIVLRKEDDGTWTATYAEREDLKKAFQPLREILGDSQRFSDEMIEKGKRSVLQSLTGPPFQVFNDIPDEIMREYQNAISVSYDEEETENTIVSRWENPFPGFSEEIAIMRVSVISLPESEKAANMILSVFGDDFLTRIYTFVVKQNPSTGEIESTIRIAG